MSRLLSVYQFVYKKVIQKYITLDIHFSAVMVGNEISVNKKTCRLKLADKEIYDVKSITNCC